MKGVRLSVQSARGVLHLTHDKVQKMHVQLLTLAVSSGFKTTSADGLPIHKDFFFFFTKGLRYCTMKGGVIVVKSEKGEV